MTLMCHSDTQNFLPLVKKSRTDFSIESIVKRNDLQQQQPQHNEILNSINVQNKQELLVNSAKEDHDMEVLKALRLSEMNNELLLHSFKMIPQKFLNYNQIINYPARDNVNGLIRPIPCTPNRTEDVCTPHNPLANPHAANYDLFKELSYRHNLEKLSHPPHMNLFMNPMMLDRTTYPVPPYFINRQGRFFPRGYANGKLLLIK